MALSKSVNYFVMTSMQMIARLFSLLCLIVLRRYVFSLRRLRLKNGAKVWHELHQIPAINRSAAEQFKCFKMNRKDLFQNKNFNIF